jgi:hypothetical protein
MILWSGNITEVFGYYLARAVNLESPVIAQKIQAFTVLSTYKHAFDTWLAPSNAFLEIVNLSCRCKGQLLFNSVELVENKYLRNEHRQHRSRKARAVLARSICSR